MFWVFVSAILIICFVRFSGFLLVIAVFSFYMAFSGVRVLKIKKTSKVEKIDWSAAIITMIFGMGMVGLGAYYLLATEQTVLGLLCFFFGFLIASITAFLVQNGRMFDLPSDMARIPWVLPALIGSPLTSYWANKYRKQFKLDKYVTA